MKVMHPPLPPPLRTWDQYSTFPLEKSVGARVGRETAKIYEKPEKEEDLGPEFCYSKWKMVVLWERMAALSNGDCGSKPWGGLQEKIFRNLSNAQEERPLGRNSESDGYHFITNPPSQRSVLISRWLPRPRDHKAAFPHFCYQHRCAPKPEWQNKFYAIWKGEALQMSYKFNSDHSIAVHSP